MGIIEFRPRSMVEEPLPLTHNAQRIGLPGISLITHGASRALLWDREPEETAEFAWEFWKRVGGVINAYASALKAGKDLNAVSFARDINGKEVRLRAYHHPTGANGQPWTLIMLPSELEEEIRWFQAQEVQSRGRST